MQLPKSALALLTSLFIVAAAPAPSPVLEERATPSQCGQYSTLQTGAFTLASNEWGATTSGTSGSQCSYIAGLQGSSLSWWTTWTWSGPSGQVKSYTNAQVSIPQKAVSQYTSIPTTWKWAYTGTNLACNVAYDTFLGASASSANEFEVMVWLGLYGGVSPLSANGMSNRHPFYSSRV